MSISTPPNSPPVGDGLDAAGSGNVPVSAPAPQANIGYITEYRHRDTGQILKEVFHDVPLEQPAQVNPDSPIFDLVTTYSVLPSTVQSRGPKSSTDEEDYSEYQGDPFFSIIIRSSAILKALSSVVMYYPNQEISNEARISWPYCILVHHYKELTDYANDREGINPDSLCIRERAATTHLRELLKFLDNNVMEGVRAEQERNARGYFTFDHSWVYMKPGQTFAARLRSDLNWTSGVIMSLEGGTFTKPVTGTWEIHYWSFQYNGQFIARIEEFIGWDRFDGEASFDTADLKLIDVTTLSQNNDTVVREMIRKGRMYCRLLTKQCMDHHGESIQVPPQRIDGLVMADADAALVTGFVPESLTTADLRHEELHCPCSFCQRSHDSPRTQRFRPTFWDYADIAPPSRGGTELTDHQCLLCPPFARVFVFKTRSWEFVNMSNLSDPVFEETMMDSLILDERKRQTIVSLSKSFARRNKQDLEIPKPVWSPDFVAGKGTGLTFLLHGRPGVGKTLTAECVAALTKRPLMILTASDIGTNPEQVEKNLTEQFKLAQSWSAVLLIDQADVFMERRSTADLLRNSLVAGFLRALEYYQGILFLTTNRVGSFDDALISRIHVQLYYPEFTEAQRQMVWKTFIKKLEHDRKGYMRLDYAAKDYIRHSGMGSLKWNGREIRNAFQTAVSLAEYEAEKDEEGTILVTEDHLRAVVELSKDFKDYLNELHIVDEEKRAQNRFERVDNFREDRN